MELKKCIGNEKYIHMKKVLQVQFVISNVKYSQGVISYNKVWSYVWYKRKCWELETLFVWIVPNVIANLPIFIIFLLVLFAISIDISGDIWHLLIIINTFHLVLLEVVLKILISRPWEGTT